jgi:hypothetical protein
MKKLYSVLGFLLLASMTLKATDFTSTGTGDWNNAATWSPSGVPGAGDNVTILINHIITLTADAACNNLTITVPNGLLQAGSFTLQINGILAATGTSAPGNIITTSGGGIVKFVGAGRALFGTWGPFGINWRCEVALNSGQTGTGGSATHLFGYLKISSGIFDCSGELRINASGGNGAGSMDISSGATLIARNNVTKSTTAGSYFGAINVDGTLEIVNNTNGQFINVLNVLVNDGGTLKITGNVSSSLSSNSTPQTSFTYAPSSTLEYVNNFSSSNFSNNITTGVEWSLGKITAGSSGPSVSNVVFDAANDNETTIATNGSIYGTATMKRGSVVGNLLLYQPGSTLIFNGSIAQTGTGLSPFSSTLKIFPSTLGSPPENLTIDNPAGVTFDDDAGVHVISSVLNFVNGKITSATPGLFVLDVNASVTGAGGSSFVDGYIGKNTNSTNPFSFPVGNGSVYHPCTITSMDAAANTFQAQYINSNPKIAVGNTFTAPLSNITDIEYWDISHASGSSQAKITLDWSAPITGGTATDNIRVAHWNSGGSTWEDFGANGAVVLGNVGSGSVTSNAVSSFSPITIGLAPAAALPVKLISFTGIKHGSDAILNWKVADPQDAKRYELYESGDGMNFSLLTTVVGDPVKENYSATDNSLSDGSNYYRLKAFDIDGSFYYSNIVVIFNKNNGVELLRMVPTLVNSSANLNVTSAARSKINILITDMQGRVMQRVSGEVATGENSIRLNLGGLASGTYQLTATTGDGTVKTIRFIKL